MRLLEIRCSEFAGRGREGKIKNMVDSDGKDPRRCRSSLQFGSDASDLLLLQSSSLHVEQRFALDGSRYVA
jgi:hypothetical protein